MGQRPARAPVNHLCTPISGAFAATKRAEEVFGMPRSLVPLLRCALLAGVLALGACGRGDDNNIAEIDNALLANGADPALTSALEDQILVDPNLVQQAHPNTVRPPEAPVQAQYPAGSAAEGVRQASATTGPVLESGDCAGAFQHGAQWANRLPPGFPLYPRSRITEAAGNGAGNCRVVIFRTADRFDRVIDFYRQAAGRAGFTADAQVRGGDHVLGGVNETNDGAYYLIVTPQPDGSEVALIVNRGR
jgi:hypothetical protein